RFNDVGALDRRFSIEADRDRKPLIVVAIGHSEDAVEIASRALDRTVEAAVIEGHLLLLEIIKTGGIVEEAVGVAGNGGVGVAQRDRAGAAAAGRSVGADKRNHSDDGQSDG